MKTETYVPLHARSNHSLLWGASTVAELAARASSFGLPALALTDDDNLYGLIPFLDACGKAGVRPIVGASVSEPGGPRAVLLVRDGEGYENLCRILTRRKLSEGEGEPPFSLAEALAERNAGLTVLTESASLAEAVLGAVSRDRLWLELVRPGRPLAFQRRLARASRRLRLGLVASPDAVFAHPGRHALHRTLAAVRKGALISQLKPGDAAPPSACLPSPAEMAERFADVPGALENTLRVAEACRGRPPGGRHVFPDFPLPTGETASSHLQRIALEGLAMRYGPLPPASAKARLKRELGVIEKLGFSLYFVVVGDIVRFARTRGIPVVGRGSGAGSIVAYALGITSVDPLRYGLYFERFLHEQRADLPDLDVDFCWRGRDEVLDHVYAFYGRERAAMISTLCTMRPRSAFRETAKAHGVPASVVDRLSRRIPFRPDVPLAEAIRIDPAASRAIPAGEEPFRSALEDAEALEGFPRHLGIHPGGVVIADRPLDRYVPLEWAAKGIVVTQFEMRAVERIGLVKFDLLGNRALTTLRDTVEGVRRDLGVTVDLEAISEKDPGAAGLLSEGSTLSCFQIESPAMRHLLRQLEVKDLDATIDALSLVRPGPAGAGMKEAYVRRASGAEPVVYPHPRLANLLAGRFGVLLYEEDVMAAVAALTDGTLAEGDLVRRAVAKSEGEEDRRALRADFLRRARACGVDGAGAEAVWGQVVKFAKYAFCRAHAAGYGVLAHRSAALKARFPTAYACAVMNNHAGMYPSRVHLEEARRRGVGILPPDVNLSADRFVTEGGDAVRVGLSRVRALSRRTREAMYAERGRRPFESLGDFLRRVPVSWPEAENLIRAGAFSFTGRTRPELLYRLRVAFPGARREAGRGGGHLFSGDLCPAEGMRLPEYDPLAVLRLELESLGLFVSGHPMRALRGHLDGKAVSAVALGGLSGRRASVAGLLSARRSTRTEKGDRLMGFATLEDETGLCECTFFPASWKRCKPLLRGLGPFLAKGRVEDHFGAVSLTVEGLLGLRIEGFSMGDS